MAATYSVVVAGVLGPQSVANILHFELSQLGSDNPVTQANALMAALDGTFLDNYCACLPVAYHITSLKAKRVWNPGGPTSVKLFSPTDYPGTRTGEVSTTATGPVVLSQGLKSSRYCTAKIFMPGASETDIAVNVFTAPLLAALATFIGSLQTTISLGGGLGDALYTIYRRSTKESYEPEVYKVSLKPGTQRRRLVPIA